VGWMNSVARSDQGREALIAICLDLNDSDSIKNRIEQDQQEITQKNR
jgi:hypothetical protein